MLGWTKKKEKKILKETLKFYDSSLMEVLIREPIRQGIFTESFNVRDEREWPAFLPREPHIEMLDSLMSTK